MSQVTEVIFLDWLQHLLSENKASFGIDTVYTKETLPAKVMPRFLMIFWSSIGPEEEGPELQYYVEFNLGIVVVVSGAGAERTSLKIAAQVRNYIRQNISSTGISNIHPTTLRFGEILKEDADEDGDDQERPTLKVATLPLSIEYEYPIFTGS